MNEIGMNHYIEAAFAHFDEYNKQDPNIVHWEGTDYPQEYFLAIKLFDWIVKLSPNAGEALLLASRAQHIGRWEIPRHAFPLDKPGYLLWRKTLAAHHAEKARGILSKLGFSDTVIDEVEEIILKKKLKVNPSVQTMENALCLVFLEYQYEDFFPKHREKIVHILKKSLLKMDAQGHRFALTLSYSDEGIGYIEEALAQLGTKN
ncbi:DUF4202 domain-containing protein [Sphingobacterium suaedae]|uniref:DUF4202 domain-containing protein n=1 Tax=Sphingobacterium suaedae TaxID=1686402 RepID=A0ABW5KDA3_9SPHI